jgi:hypothetical protein
MYDMLGGYLTTARVLLQLGAPPDSAGLSQAVTRCVQDSNWVVREAAAECVACLFASRRRDSPASAASQSCPALKERGEGMDGGAGGLCGGPESFEAVKSVAKALSRTTVYFRITCEGRQKAGNSPLLFLVQPLPGTLGSCTRCGL